MKSSAIVCAIATVALAASSLSQAQNRDEYRRGQDPRQDSRSQVVLVQPATVHYFNAPSNLVAELERVYRITDAVIRYLIVRKDD